MGKVSHLRPVAGKGKEVRVRAVDMDSGEVLDGIPMLFKPKTRHISEEFVVVFLEALEAVSMDRDLGAQELRVLTFMLGKIGFSNDLKNLNQSEMGKALGMHRSHVNRAIKKLMAKGLITQGVRIGNGHVYGLNPNFAWRGKAAAWSQARKAAPSLKLVKGGREPLQPHSEPHADPSLIEPGSESALRTDPRAIELQLQT